MPRACVHLICGDQGFSRRRKNTGVPGLSSHHFVLEIGQGKEGRGKEGLLRNFLRLPGIRLSLTLEILRGEGRGEEPSQPGSVISLDQRLSVQGSWSIHLPSCGDPAKKRRKEEKREVALAITS